MTGPIPDDDDYMVSMARQLLERYATSGREEDLVAAVLSANQVLNWHVGTRPTEAERDRFADEFPTWRILHDVAEGRLGIASGGIGTDACRGTAITAEADPAGQGVECGALATRCRDFLAAFEARHLSGTQPDLRRRRPAERSSGPLKR